MTKPPNPQRRGWLVLILKQQSCEIFVGSFPKVSFKVQRTEILWGFGALHLNRIRIKFATNIMVLCTFLEPNNPARRGTHLEVINKRVTTQVDASEGQNIG